MDCKAIMLAYNILSKVHKPLHTPGMPLYTHLLGIRETGLDETRTYKRTRPRNMENTQVQPMGRKRIRPGTVRF